MSDDDFTTTASLAKKTKTSDDYKELGNKAFARKDFQTAIEHYTKAIQHSSSNSNKTNSNNNRHIFYSNRSASYAGLKQWTKAIDDAKECIRLDPQFVKGYYRLATAQLEAKDLQSAEATIKQGLGLDADNSQLLKVLRNIKLHRKAAEEAKRTVAGQSNTQAGNYPSSAMSSAGGGRMLDAATSQELHDLQVQYSTTAREYSLVQADLQKAVREDKMYNITLKELQENPAKQSKGDGDDGRYYRSVGKIFLKSSHNDVVDHLNKNIDVHQKKQKAHKGKLEYLEKKLKSQQLNMKELTGQAMTTTTPASIPTTTTTTTTTTATGSGDNTENEAQ
mmetsp:Transcript_26077/g.61938  ORF Transcript_26077/g.61938 Transcript_26077/m.61938 type:complete len:335 (-) Transcript_26077:1320-2324(-)|eukprot:CAMPEP_0113458266 /NCGR_PEP_ID=MMETSP0014_2-20120614/9835_1 /TAXON_ID=2857 /ORGANISM="Nitzschia sp." /LENGTH=334 /DNA_ID=CAMNT_0000349787 /DNA_START=159 /DNA_END=1163 /DNA_ORIENTATION=+ /assembly_acc=CAM_ASM_000159